MYIYSRINYMNINMECDTCVWSRCVRRLLHLPPPFASALKSHTHSLKELTPSFFGSPRLDLKNENSDRVWCQEAVDVVIASKLSGNRVISMRNPIFCGRCWASLDLGRHGLLPVLRIGGGSAAQSREWLRPQERGAAHGGAPRRKVVLW